MAQTSFALMTNLGRAKEAAALANGTTITITHIAIGDGATVPSGGEITLYHEVARKTISGHGTVVGASNVAYFDCFLAAAEGPYTIREAGLIDSAGDLIAIAHYDPPINKPVPASGQTVEGTVRLEVAFSDVANVTIKIDPAMQVALQRLTRLPWVPVLSMSVASPPVAPAVGDTYLIAASPTGSWAGQAGKIAEFTNAGWAILAPPNGHGVSLPDGRIFVREAGAGSYVELKASLTHAGVVELATSEETAAGESAELAVTPQGVRPLFQALGMVPDPIEAINAGYPFAANVQPGDLVYLYQEANTAFNPATYVPVEYRRSLDRNNGTNIYKTQAGQQVIDYAVYSMYPIGFADPAANLIWLDGLPKSIRPTGLEANKEWWLSDTNAGKLRNSQPFPNREPIGFTDTAGFFTTYGSQARNQFQQAGLSRSRILVVAANNEDVSARVRYALRRSSVVHLSVPAGVTAKISHSRIEIRGRTLIVMVDGTLECTHECPQSPYLGSGAWREIAQFTVGQGAVLAFSGSGNIKHLTTAGPVAPNNSGFITIERTASAIGAFVKVDGQYVLNIHLSNTMINHDGDGSRASIAILGCTLRKVAGALIAAPKIVTRGSWGFAAGRVELETVSVNFLDGITRGTPSNADGSFVYSQIDARNPNFTY